LNIDDQDKYEATNTHPAIISKEFFERVQAEKARRSYIEIDMNGKIRKSTHYSIKKSENSTNQGY